MRNVSHYRTRREARLTYHRIGGLDEGEPEQRQAEDDPAAVPVGGDAIRDGGEEPRKQAKGELPALEGGELGLDALVLAARVCRGL